jgi:MFS family permease
LHNATAFKRQQGRLQLTFSGEAPARATALESYRTYVLAVLCLTFTFNFIDRVLLNIVQEPIKREFALTDFQLGLLGGPAFAIFYTLLGIPIARLAERVSRVAIVSVSVAAWSVMTALCGVASNFSQLLLARMGVGMGEAGCVPASHSIISDYFPPERRTSALSIYSLGTQIGTVLAALLGGWVAQTLGWRTAFIVIGLPGILLALVLALTVKEPARAHATHDTPPFFATLKALFGKRTFRHVIAGASIVSFVAFSIFQYLNSFLMRSHGLTLIEASMLTGVALGVCAAIGLLGSAFLIEATTKRWPNALTWLPALGLIIAGPLYILAFNAPSIWVAAPALMCAAITHFFYIGPMFSITQGVAEPRMRATATAVLLFLLNLIGTAIGPPAIGALSDFLASIAMNAENLTFAQCTTPTSEIAAQCTRLQGTGLRWALSAGVLTFIWGGVHFVLAGRSARDDLVV